MNHTKILIMTLLSSLILFSCKEDDDGGHNDHSHLSLHVHSKFRDSDLSYNQEYAFADGRKIIFTKARVYLTEITLNTDHSDIVFDGVHLSVGPESHSQVVGDFTVDHIMGLSFNQGVDSAANHADPATFAASDPLSPSNDSYEHWNWNSGYKFVVIEGMIDTSATANGTANKAFEMHIGSDQLLRRVTLTDHQDVPLGTDFELMIELDFAKAFEGLDLTTDHTTHTMDNMPAAMTVINNLESAYSVN